LLDPIDYGTRIYVEETTDFMSCIDCFVGTLALIRHYGRKTYGRRLEPYSFSYFYGRTPKIPLGVMVLSQFAGKFAMEINVRDWKRDDLPQIQHAWLDYCRRSPRPDMRLRSNAESLLKEWLTLRFRTRETLGFVAENDGTIVGFLIGRI